MLTVFSCCHKDADLALTQAKWIRELGGAKKHPAILAVNQECQRRDQHTPILEILRESFESVKLFTPFDQIEDGWPMSPNHMWVRVVQRIRDVEHDVPFLWMEADAAFTTNAGIALDQIEHQFLDCHKQFMGDYVTFQDVPPHMSGIGVYHQTWKSIPEFSAIDKTAWDVALCNQFLSRYHRTNLIQHDWKPQPFASFTDLSRIRKDVVIYHQCKDGSLMDRLREARGIVAVSACQASSPEGVGATPAPATPNITATTVWQERSDPDHDWGSREANLLAEIDRLKALVPVDPKKHGVQMKKSKRTPEQQAAIDARMAKARAGRKKAMA